MVTDDSTFAAAVQLTTICVARSPEAMPVTVVHPGVVEGHDSLATAQVILHVQEAILYAVGQEVRDPPFSLLRPVAP
ncbi:hypothetical protein J6590_097574 [Homalodisca vitripennis]|nr:hypothetical protein J6590_097574 [Homalodisca vitripennis]